MKVIQSIAMVIVLAITTVAAAQMSSPDLHSPVHVMAGGSPLDVQRVGHAAPCFNDFDGDGLKDLLVGQFEEGWLRIYRNQGTNAQPQFSGHEWFRAGADLGRVPTG